MMKRIILFFLLLFATSSIQAQEVRIGLKLSPVLSVNRVESESDVASFSSNGSGGRFQIGPTIDIPLTENYFFTTGILYTSKRAGIKAAISGTNYKEAYNLQYIQIPITLKLLTNEVAPATKAYLQLGLGNEIKINEKAKDKNNVLIESFRIFDISALLGGGIQYDIEGTTSLMLGFTYYRGLANTVKDHIDLDEKIILKNDILSLDFRILF